MFGNKFLKPFKDISIEYDKIIFCYVEDSKLIEKVKGKENNIVFYTEGKFYLIILKLYLENFIIPYNHHLIQIFNQYFSDKVINNKNNFLLFINKKNDKFDFKKNSKKKLEIIQLFL